MNPQLILPARGNGPLGMHIPGPTMKGEYRYIKLNAKREVVFETDWQPNLITNGGLDRIGSGNTPVSHCQIGTGNTAPANTDSALVALYAATNTVVAQTGVNNGASAYETATTSTFEFALGAVIGNMAEVGCGWAATGSLFSRALIVDGGGAPTTISVLVTEILQVVYRFTVYPNLTDATGAVTIGAANTYTSRAMSAGSILGCSPLIPMMGIIFSVDVYNNVIGATTAVPTGTTASITPGSFAAYVNGNYYRDYTVGAALAVGNIASGIKSLGVVIGGSGQVFKTQIQFGTALTKDATKVLSITLRQPWSRHP